MRQVADADIWTLRSNARAELVRYTRRRLARQLASSGCSAAQIDEAGRVLDPEALTLCFARRFATYKRPNLLLHDPERLVRILTNPDRPVQLLIAGKAHPADQPGQAIIRQWANFIRRRPEVRPHVVFLSDYDMLLTEQLVHGVDVWINNPRRPWEACGTSGMKILANGGLNLSELDGWWAEAYTDHVGWAIGDGTERGDDAQWDAAEADALYRKLEQEIIPLFYYRDKHGLPVGWIARVRESMARLTPQFSADRAVREYTEKYYLPAASRYHERAKDDGASAAHIVGWRREIEKRWASVTFGPASVQTDDAHCDFHVSVNLGDLPPESVQVELFADALPGSLAERHVMSRETGPEQSSSDEYSYSVRVPTTRPATDYTPRLIPNNDEMMVPLEAFQILWQR